MGFTCGLVGLPNAGKSTIFNSLTRAGALVASYPFSTIEPKEGKVEVPDPRLSALARLLGHPKVTPTTLTFIDIAGLVKNAHQGEGLGNRFLAHIREVDAVAHVVRFFKSGDASQPGFQPDPLADFDLVLTELMLADLETVERRREKAERMAKIGNKEVRKEMDLLLRLEASLSKGIPASKVSPKTAAEEKALRDLFLLTAKPAMILANIAEDQLHDRSILEPLERHALEFSMSVVPICGKLESELVELEAADRKEFMAHLGLERLALEKVVEAGYALLDLVTFYTTAGTELRAWTVPSATPAPRAAGKIHSDMEKGFIKAEVISFPELMRSGSQQAARRNGLIRMEGKDYIIRDGDVVFFHFRT